MKPFCIKQSNIPYVEARMNSKAAQLRENGTEIVRLFARFALGASFLSAVADRTRPMIGMTRANAVNTLGNLRFHWPEYLMEAGELGLYMFSTCAIATLLQHPASPVRHVIANSFSRRAV